VELARRIVDVVRGVIESPAAPVVQPQPVTVNVPPAQDFSALVESVRELAKPVPEPSPIPPIHVSYPQPKQRAMRAIRDPETGLISGVEPVGQEEPLVPGPLTVIVEPRPQRHEVVVTMEGNEP
jgi:hypothetical protein